MTRTVRLAITDFATPVRRSGHIQHEANLGVLNQGAAVHRRIQSRLSALQSYSSEYPLTAEFARDEFRFVVNGRADSVFENDPVIIEDIKSSYDIDRLEHKLREQRDHPYRLQVLLYGHCWQGAHASHPELQLRLVSTHTQEERIVAVVETEAWWQEWLVEKLSALAALEKRKRARRQRRRQLVAQLQFPFASQRPGQELISAAVTASVAVQKPLLVQAPTGLGKTIAVLHSALRDSLSRGAQLVVVTPKNSQFAATLDAVTQLHTVGSKPKVLVLSAREKACLADEVNCNPTACNYANHHYDKVHEHDLRARLARKAQLTARVLGNTGQKYQVCPHALASDLIDDADIIVCDYNYVFSPRFSLLARFKQGRRAWRATLLIDEVQNLHERALDYFSPSLMTVALERVRVESDGYPASLRLAVQQLLDRLDPWMEIARNSPLGRPLAVDFSGLDSLVDSAVQLVAEAMASTPVMPRALTELYGTLVDFAAVEVGMERVLLAVENRDGQRGLKFHCLDAAAYLAGTYKSFAAVVGFSATLKPFAFYRDVSGFPADSQCLEVGSPFAAANRKILVIPQVSTRFRHRERQFQKISDAIVKIAAIEVGHYLCFFPSYRFMASVAEHLADSPYSVVTQNERMTQRQITAVSRQLDDAAPLLLCGVQGGMLAEGIDYQAPLLRGVFVVGPAVPTYNPERELLRKSYQQRFGDGFACAYVYPAMARSIQAAGRLIRSEDKRGIVVLLDQRFVEPQFVAPMPADWFQQTVGELVSGTILQDVRAFWQGSGDAP